MGRIIDGQWSTHDLGPDEKGRYVRRATVFRDWIRADGSTDYPAEVGRYHLYVSAACGWSHRTLIVRKLRGLEAVIGLSVADPFMGEQGWTYSDGADPINGVERHYELFLKANPSYTGRASVPVLWDSERQTIVSNESVEIAEMFDRELSALVEPPTKSLLPAGQREAIYAMIQANYAVNNGVYGAGFAGSQTAYAEAVDRVFGRLDALEVLLKRQRFLLGSEPTLADFCLFPTLYRFDPIYHIHFKCCLRQLRDYPALWAYTRDLYQWPGVAETCDLEATRTHYYTSHESIHPRRYVPSGPTPDYGAPHDRAQLG